MTQWTLSGRYLFWWSLMLLTVSRLRGEVTALDENALLSTPPPDAGEMPLVTTDVAERSRSHDGFERSQDRDTEFVNGTGNVTEGMCQCQPACPDDESETPDDCPWNRTVVRPDCLCCPVKVCARQAAEACNFNRLPCDEELGLRCDNDTNTCSGPFNLRVTKTTHNSSSLWWWTRIKSSEKLLAGNLTLHVTRNLDGNDTLWQPTNASIDEGSITVEELTPSTVYYLKLDDGDRFEITILKTEAGCFVNGTSYGILESFTVDCEQKCKCGENGVAMCEPRCPPREPQVVDEDCKEVPDPEDPCCTILSCNERDGHSLLARDPQVILTGRTPDSLTVAWDDFKVPGPSLDHGYVVEYRPAIRDDEGHSPWTRIPVENAPNTTIRHLRPNTPYEVRVFIWEDLESNRYGPSTEIMTLTTADGCIWNNRTLTVGASFDKGCESTCTCLGNDTTNCRARCVDGQRPKGSFMSDSFCTEEPIPNNPCCVTVVCPSSSVSEPAIVSHLAFPDEMDDTPTTPAIEVTLTSDGECPSHVPDHGGECKSSCKSDSDCPEQKCCLTDCGSTICVPFLKTEISPITKDPCNGVVCGPNAICGQFGQNAQCWCLPGFSGNPLNGCISVVHPPTKLKSKAGCTFGNATYLVGETFYSGCEYKCECTVSHGSYVTACQPRCPEITDKFRVFDPACHTHPDPKDKCCEVMVCETFLENEAEHGKELLHNSSSRHLEDECQYKGKMYHRDEHFYDGCENSCLCLGLGEVECNPRCPKTPKAKPGCVVVPHPADEECCTLVVCNPTNLNFTFTNPENIDEGEESGNETVTEMRGSSTPPSDSETMNATSVVVNETNASTNTNASSHPLKAENTTRGPLSDFMDMDNDTTTIINVGPLTSTLSSDETVMSEAMLITPITSPMMDNITVTEVEENTTMAAELSDGEADNATMVSKASSITTEPVTVDNSEDDENNENMSDNTSQEPPLFNQSSILEFGDEDAMLDDTTLDMSDDSSITEPSMVTPEITMETGDNNVTTASIIELVTKIMNLTIEGAILNATTNVTMTRETPSLLFNLSDGEIDDMSTTSLSVMDDNVTSSTAMSETSETTVLTSLFPQLLLNDTMSETNETTVLTSQFPQLSLNDTMSVTNETTVETSLPQLPLNDTMSVTNETTVETSLPQLPLNDTMSVTNETTVETSLPQLPLNDTMSETNETTVLTSLLSQLPLNDTMSVTNETTIETSLPQLPLNDTMSVTNETTVETSLPQPLNDSMSETNETTIVSSHFPQLPLNDTMSEENETAVLSSLFPPLLLNDTMSETNETTLVASYFPQLPLNDTMSETNETTVLTSLLPQLPLNDTMSEENETSVLSSLFPPLPLNDTMSETNETTMLTSLLPQLPVNDTMSNETTDNQEEQEEATTSEDPGREGPRVGARHSKVDDSKITIDFPRHQGKPADIHRLLLINPTAVRVQILLAPYLMEKMFADPNAIAVLYTKNLTYTDLVNWERHPLSLQHNVAFVSVDRSDVAVETNIVELEPNHQYGFVVVVEKENTDPDLGLQYEQLSEIDSTVTVQLGIGTCEFMGKTIQVGERLYDECQAVCDCLPSRTVHCETILCPNQIGPERSGCLEWNVDTSFISRAPHCCPETTCKYGSMCTYKGERFRNLERIPPRLIEECDQECACVAGNVTCSTRCAHVPAEPPADLDCSEPVLLLLPGDECCKSWQCKREVIDNVTIASVDSGLIHDTSDVFSSDGDNETTTMTTTTTTTTTTTMVATTTGEELLHDRTNVTNVTEEIVQPECVFDNVTYKLNEQWRVGKGHRQKLCSCLLLPNGTAAAECQGGCPPILNQQADLIPGCPPENVVILDVPDLCPYVICNKSELGGGITNVSVEILNSSSIRVNFVIPIIYVGLYGHIEILYTTDLTHSDDTTTWSKEVFSGPSNQFETTKHSHEMTGLQPDKEYFLKVIVVIKNTKNIDSSKTITVKMPPLPTTTTTTTTTTLPPRISIDPHLNATDLQASSAKLTWRTFDAKERRFVDGVFLQYKPHDDPSQQWSKTTMIHRDVTSYTLEQLKPNSEYDARIIVVPPGNVTTEVDSGLPISFRTTKVFDDYEFILKLTIGTIGPYSVEYIWSGVPIPEQKYVNVYKFLYRVIGLEDREGFIYRPPKGSQFTFVVEGLTPETNYTVWMEAILSNGKTRPSNGINITTSPGPAIMRPSEKEKFEASQQNDSKNSGNAYYAALIVVAVIAALCALGFVILLILLLRKQSSAKAPITSGKTHSAYDNPTYKTYDSELENGKNPQP